MAYNADNEVKEVIDTFDKNQRGDKVRISKVTNKKSGNVKVDIREMYTSTDGELKYGTTGIRISSDMGADVIIAMINALGPDVKQDILLKLEESENEA